MDSGGCISGIFLGPPCSSWSIARHGPPGSSWGPIRSKTHIYGIPNLRCEDKIKVAYGNETMRKCAQILNTAAHIGKIPTAIEQPSSSLLFSAPPIKRLLPSGHLNTFDMCGYGARWRKRTRIYSWGCSSPLARVALCQGKKGLSSFSSKKHIELTGKDPASNCFWTSIAQSYPQKLAFDIARMLVDASRERSVRALLGRNGL